MSLNRFKLDDPTAHATGVALPPYWHWQENARAGKKADFTGEENAAAKRAGDFENQAEEAGGQEWQVMVRQNALGYPMAMPLEIQVPGKNKMWTFPWEPVITVKGKNVITRRRVAKSEKRGTIKEYWTQDDYEINIQGMMMNYFQEQSYPTDDVDILRQICEARQSLRVNCELLELFGIQQIVIEDFDLPFTKGENVQGYVIKAYSDDLFDLLIDETVLNRQ